MPSGQGKRNLACTKCSRVFLVHNGFHPHYCGFDLPPTGMAIDRKDSQIGYTPSNVVPCCIDCNLAKNESFSYDEMLLLGAVIRDIKLRRQERGQSEPEHQRSIGCPRKY
jgi:hypothetical protein